MKTHVYFDSDGIIRWIKEMPEYPAVANQFDPHDSVYFADVYQKALEQAKSESIPFEDQSTEHKIALLNTKPCFWKRNEIYPIELDADIQPFPVHCGGKNCPGNDGCWGNPKGCGYPDKYVAKIIPKKAEEIDYKKHLKYDLEELKSGRPIKVVSRKRLIRYLEETLK